MSESTPKRKTAALTTSIDYSGLLGGISDLLEVARRASARAVNALMTATYWEVGRRIVEFEQGGEKRAGYGEELLVRLANDLTRRLAGDFPGRTCSDSGSSTFHSRSKGFAQHCRAN